MSLRYLAWRLTQFVGTLLLLSLIVFALLYLAPGDIVKTLVGPRQVSEEVREAVTTKYNLDKPFVIQYGLWLGRALRGNFGESIRSGNTVAEEILERLPITVSLVFFAAFLGIFIGIFLGVLAARRASTAVDRAIVGWSIVGVSAPGFAIGLVLLYVFSALLGWFPTYGNGEGFLDTLWHLTLPAIVLALGIGASIVRITRVSVLGELGEDYVTFARARALKPSRVTAMYMRNAFIPILTSAGLILGTLFGSTVLVENVFSISGLGTLLTDSIAFKDIAVVQAIVLLIAFIIMVITLIVDLLVVVIDPTQSIHRGRSRV